MKKLFKEILEIDDIKGVLFLSTDGKVLFKEFAGRIPAGIDTTNWGPFSATFGAVREAELIFDTLRIYLRRSSAGYILVVMGMSALIAMVRLNCDIIIPALEDQKKPTKGFGRFFK
jgi:hypothetical protein